MNVRLIGATPNAEEQIVYVARVSSSRKDKAAKPEGLINYLIKHKHWSPFEHASMTVEIETSKAIGIQLIRHRSFTFQEFSQRYQDVNQLGGMFEPIEFRKQCEDNRQSSSEVIDPHVPVSGGYIPASTLLSDHLVASRNLYDQLLAAGVAREQARMVLPLATKTKIYMTGTVRSWIHFLDMRDDGHAQKEIQEVARAVKEVFKKQFPIMSNALGYV
jgi:thymidylate synthase (FAD)